MTGILFAAGFEEVEAVTPLDFLRRAGIDTVSVGLNKKNIIGSHGIEINCDVCLEADIPRLDSIIIPGGMPGAKNIAESAKAREIISSIYRNHGLIAAICAAPAVVLAPMGILDGKTATCFPGFEERFSNSTNFSEDRVVVDANIITSRAAGTAAEFALTIITYLKDPETAKKIHNVTLQK